MSFLFRRNLGRRQASSGRQPSGWSTAVLGSSAVHTMALRESISFMHSCMAAPLQALASKQTRDPWRFEDRNRLAGEMTLPEVACLFCSVTPDTHVAFQNPEISISHILVLSILSLLHRLDIDCTSAQITGSHSDIPLQALIRASWGCEVWRPLRMRTDRSGQPFNSRKRLLKAKNAYR